MAAFHWYLVTSSCCCLEFIEIVTPRRSTMWPKKSSAVCPIADKCRAFLPFKHESPFLLLRARETQRRREAPGLAGRGARQHGPGRRPHAVREHPPPHRGVDPRKGPKRRTGKCFSRALACFVSIRLEVDTFQAVTSSRSRLFPGLRAGQGEPGEAAGTGLRTREPKTWGFSRERMGSSWGLGLPVVRLQKSGYETRTEHRCEYLESP